MATRALQPSEYEIQREVEALRDIRRRSITPGALTIDPDLPNQTPAPSPTTRARPVGSPTSPHRSDSDSSSSSYERSSSDRSSHGGASVESTSTEAASTGVTDDPFHLFWVPASVHPEIAPAEFRAFLKEHARTVPPAEGPELGRSTSSSSTSALGRKTSLLRRQYQPRENDGVEEEKVVPLRRNRSYLYNPVPQLNFTDLQRLEQLAEEASESDDSSKLRTLLRRSLSLNLSPSAIDRMDNVPDMGDEADAPIIVPPPGQILRRAARTKIRKPGLPGDGGGHRFGSTRRTVRATTLPPTADQRTSSDFSSSDHGESPGEVDPSAQQRRQTFSDDGFMSHRPDSFSEEGFIFDAYARDEDEELPLHVPLRTSSSPPPPDANELSPSQESPHLPLPEVQPALLDALGPILHQPQPQRLLSSQDSAEFQHLQPSRTPSPPAEAPPQTATPEIPATTSYAPPLQQQQQQLPPPTIQQQQQPSSYPPQIYQPQPTVPQQPPPSKGKDKKGLFKWGGDKSSKKSRDRESRERPEKESGFFGSLFGGSKKKQDSELTPSMVGGNAGREAAQALLGASKSSKNYVPPPSPGLAAGTNPYARYPIHVERAIYRLSHIKLANPRRPLYEQVLISNLMFWYLGVINKAQNPASQAQPNDVTASETDNAGVGSQTAEDIERDQREREQREQEQREKAEKERVERERLEREREREREIEMKKKESGRRGSLTKTPAGGVPGGRRAEMPIKGPQYEMQHRVMEQEYGNYNMQSAQQVGRLPSPTNGVPSQHYPRQQTQQYPNSPPKLISPQPTHAPEQQFYDGQQQQQRLPPGAMPPVDQATSWMSQSNGQPPRNPSPQRSRTPPSQNHITPPPIQRQTPSLPQDGYAGVGVGGGRPGRSLSANAVPPPQANGAKLRKGASAHAVPSSLQSQGRRPRTTSEGKPENEGGAGAGEEEDMPLATLRQQQRRIM
ncbi:hypothetical protein P691DRAFT_755388 [Macrolepiota fuliginosa MF-IS2]|uniref:Protein Zds1 C-terminal domain-containing protein n=1 Tax=Macrolepiota fuliginosa MF-IS2 TaxID=1400762 RepID=A0A9P5XPM9_9AGAR|nr:hypothetical protein P691DRAFT_755388 [Macrolepiota fuliginosa MF-IS2]